MRFGYNTGFSAKVRDGVDYQLLGDIDAAGYDYAEFPLAPLASLPAAAFDELETYMRASRLGVEACSHMFPPRLRLTGPKADFREARDYLAGAFPRMRRLGCETIVFGSSGARNLPEGTTPEEGYRQLTEFLNGYVVPLLEDFDLALAVEPIGSYEANFINTLTDGMRLVSLVDHPRVRLLADSVHVLYEGEDIGNVGRYAPYLRHVHVCEPLRALPVPKPSDKVAEFLRTLRATGYDRRVSFESVPSTREDMALALQNLKEALL